MQAVDPISPGLLAQIRRGREYRIGELEAGERYARQIEGLLIDLSRAREERDRAIRLIEANPAMGAWLRRHESAIAWALAFVAVAAYLAVLSVI